MKTKMNLILLPVVFVIASMFISCNSVGIAAENPPPYVESQKIVFPKEPPICATLDPITQCWETFTDCNGKPLGGDGIDRKVFFDKVFSEAKKVNHILGSSCDSFIVDVEGNTKYCCTPRKCYVCR
jgi:hypothetical protein